MLTTEQIRSHFESMRGKRVLVVGDLMLDRYIHGRVERISPEAPVPIVEVLEERAVPGGACNVALNVQALGGQAVLCGMVGTDAKGDELLGLLESAGVDVSGVLRDASVTTIVKERVLADRQQIVRVDYEFSDYDVLAAGQAFLDTLDQQLQQTDGVVLEDYGKGCLEQVVVDRVMAWRRSTNRPVGLDPKDNHELNVKGISFATPNRKEAFVITKVDDRGYGVAPLKDTGLLNAAEGLRELWEPEHLMITLGPDGMLLEDAAGKPDHVSTRAREVFDVSGAGDTVIAVTMLALTAGISFREAAELANMAAGVVVAKLGTATCDPEEVVQFLEESV